MTAAEPELPPELEEVLDQALQSLERDQIARREIALDLLLPDLKSIKVRRAVLDIVTEELDEISMREIHIILDGLIEALTKE